MQDLAQWLEKLGMSEYAQRFAENGISAAAPPHLTDQDLKDIGVLLGHRRTILAAVTQLGGPTTIKPEGTVGSQDIQKVKAAMALLKLKSEKLGPVKIESTDTVEGKGVPTVFFGATKMNNNSTLVDEIVEEVGGTAKIFVKSGADYVRIATNVKKDDGSRAIGTILDPKGKAIEFINMNKAFYGAATILGKSYLTRYEPMHDASNHVIGIYYFGYMVNGSLTAR